MPFENWESDNKRSPALIVVLALVVCLAVAGTAYAVYKITSPVSEPVVVVAPATLSKPVLNATTISTGETVQITTTLSDARPAVEVFFYQNNTAIGSAYTNSQGTAIYNRALTTVGNYVFTADCIHP
jgi:hypothetical protein